MKKQPITEKKLVDRLLNLGTQLASDNAITDIPTTIKLLRNRLYMSQEELAKLAGIPQSTISRIESGRTQPSIKTLEKIFRCFECEIAFIPVPKKLPDQIIQSKAHQVAEKQVEYLVGTMALEDQKPDNEMIEEMIKETENQIIHYNPKKIWKQS